MKTLYERIFANNHCINSFAELIDVTDLCIKFFVEAPSYRGKGTNATSKPEGLFTYCTNK